MTRQKIFLKNLLDSSLPKNEDPEVEDPEVEDLEVEDPEVEDPSRGNSEIRYR